MRIREQRPQERWKSHETQNENTWSLPVLVCTKNPFEVKNIDNVSLNIHPSVSDINPHVPLITNEALI